jgi:hypothetical protein
MIIGLSGYAQSGKDTAAQFMAEKGYQRVSFADKVRTMLYTLNPIVAVNIKKDETGGPEDFLIAVHSVRSVVNAVGWEVAKTEHEEIRRLLQVLGTDCVRNMVGDDVWVDMTFKDVHPGGNYVFTDVRFPNEARKIKAMGGQVWRIEREGYGPANDHPSEFALADWEFDQTIENGDLDFFKAKILASLAS